MYQAGTGTWLGERVESFPAGVGHLTVSSEKGWQDSGSSCPHPTQKIPHFQVLSKDQVNFTSERKSSTWHHKCQVNVFRECKA